MAAFSVGMLSRSRELRERSFDENVNNRGFLSRLGGRAVPPSPIRMPRQPVTSGAERTRTLWASTLRTIQLSGNEPDTPGRRKDRENSVTTQMQSIQSRLTTLEENKARDALLTTIEQRLAYIEANTACLPGIARGGEIAQPDSAHGPEPEEAAAAEPEEAAAGAPIATASSSEAGASATDDTAVVQSVLRGPDLHGERPAASAATPLRIDTSAGPFMDTFGGQQRWLADRLEQIPQTPPGAPSPTPPTARLDPGSLAAARLAAAKPSLAPSKPSPALSKSSPGGFSWNGSTSDGGEELLRQHEKLLGRMDALVTLCTEQFATLAVAQREGASRAKDDVRALRAQLEALETRLPSGGRGVSPPGIRGGGEMAPEASEADSMSKRDSRGRASSLPEKSSSEQRYDPEEELGFDLTDVDITLNNIRYIKQPKSQQRDQAKRAHFKRMLGPMPSCRHLHGPARDTSGSVTGLSAPKRVMRRMKSQMRRSIDMEVSVTVPRPGIEDIGRGSETENEDMSEPDRSGLIRRKCSAARSHFYQTLLKVERWANHMPVFHPLGPLRIVWNVVVISLVLYCLVSVPLQVCFFHEFQVLHPGLVSVWSIVDTVVDVIFMVDLVINFRTGYMQRGIFVRDARLICERYATHGALIDLVSSLPISLILTMGLQDTWCNPVASGNLSVVTAIAGENHMAVVDWVIAPFHNGSVGCESDSIDPELRCYLACAQDSSSLLGRANRMIRLIRFFKVVRAARLSSYLEGVFDVAHFNPGLFRLNLCLLGMLLACHWIGCIWYFILEPELRSKPSLSTIEAAFPALERDILHYPLRQIQGPFGAVSTPEVWLYGMLWASGVITGLVPFDLTPGKDGGLVYVVFTLIILFFALLINSFIISTFTSAVLTVDSASQYRKQRIDRVSQYLAFQGVDAKLRVRVIEFYRYVFAHPHSLERNELKELPAAMAAQLLVAMHKPLITNCQLFSLLDNATILRVLRRLYPITLPPTHVVIREGHVPTALYFIIRGLVRIRSKDAPSITLSDHDFFGEHGSATTDGLMKTSGAQQGKPAMGGKGGLSAVCLTYCNLMMLDHADFERVIAHSNLAAMNKKFLKMSGAGAQIKHNKRLCSVVSNVVETRQQELQRASAPDATSGGPSTSGVSKAHGDALLAGVNMTLDAYASSPAEAPNASPSTLPPKKGGRVAFSTTAAGSEGSVSKGKAENSIEVVSTTAAPDPMASI